MNKVARQLIKRKRTEKKKEIGTKRNEKETQNIIKLSNYQIKIMKIWLISLIYKQEIHETTV